MLLDIPLVALAQNSEGLLHLFFVESGAKWVAILDTFASVAGVSREDFCAWIRAYIPPPTRIHLSRLVLIAMESGNPEVINLIKFLQL